MATQIVKQSCPYCLGTGSVVVNEWVNQMTPSGNQSVLQPRHQTCTNCGGVGQTTHTAYRSDAGSIVSQPARKTNRLSKRALKRQEAVAAREDAKLRARLDAKKFAARTSTALIDAAGRWMGRTPKVVTRTGTTILALMAFVIALWLTSSQSFGVRIALALAATYFTLLIPAILFRMAKWLSYECLAIGYYLPRLLRMLVIVSVQMTFALFLVGVLSRFFGG